ncbi:MAG: cobalamin biosynthesis central domain-containing protein, partial [Nitrososphaeraceae archaeon]
MSTHNSAIVAITKQGIRIARKIKENIGDVDIYVPAKYDDSKKDINWFEKQTGEIIASLFERYDALICIFSLGAVIRLIAPFVRNKKSDPAVLVIDDRAKFVISALSGHLGGANELARKVSSFLPNSESVITTAADVNETVPVDLIGKQFGWQIENDKNVTRVSAYMVNEEKIALYQDTGQKDWWTNNSLPKNITKVTNTEILTN